jgi:hypothetical protein
MTSDHPHTVLIPIVALFVKSSFLVRRRDVADSGINSYQ